jgi:hypothetical protein
VWLREMICAAIQHVTCIHTCMHAYMCSRAERQRHRSPRICSPCASLCSCGPASRPPIFRQHNPCNLKGEAYRMGFLSSEKHLYRRLRRRETQCCTWRCAARQCPSGDPRSLLAPVRERRSRCRRRRQSLEHSLARQEVVSKVRGLWYCLQWE